jgi:hypothetical protein
MEPVDGLVRVVREALSNGRVSERELIVGEVRAQDGGCGLDTVPSWLVIDGARHLGMRERRELVVVVLTPRCLVAVGGGHFGDRLPKCTRVG